MKFKFYLFTLIVLLFLAAFIAHSGTTAVRMDNTAFDHPQRPAALFDHDDHNEAAGLDQDCAICHHVYEDKEKVMDESSEGMPCSDCHSLKASDRNSVPLRRAFHGQCKTCHFESGKGPVLCGQCHTGK